MDACKALTIRQKHQLLRSIASRGDATLKNINYESRKMNFTIVLLSRSGFLQYLQRSAIVFLAIRG